MNVSEKHAASVFNVKVFLPNDREGKRFTTYGTGMTSSCITQSQTFIITITITRHIIWKPSLILNNILWKIKEEFLQKKNILILGCLGDFGKWENNVTKYLQDNAGRIQLAYIPVHWQAFVITLSSDFIKAGNFMTR